MELYTVSETAAMLRVSPITVRRYIASGRLSAERVGRAIRVRREAIVEFVKPVVPSSERQNPDEDELSTLRESMENVIGTSRSDESTNVAGHKDEYIADAIAGWHGDDDENLVEVVSPSSPGGVEFIPVQQMIGKPTTEDDPLWDIVGIAESSGPNDVARNKHKYLADALLARKSRG